MATATHDVAGEVEALATVMLHRPAASCCG
jgi:hypothetical protein